MYIFQVNEKFPMSDVNMKFWSDYLEKQCKDDSAILLPPNIDFIAAMSLDASNMMFTPILDTSDEYTSEDFGDDFGDIEDFDDEPSIEDYKSKLKSLDKTLKDLGIDLDDLEEKKSKDFTKMSWEEIISLLEKNSYLRSKRDYSCPNNGKRTIKTIKRGNETLFDITCDCSKVKNLMDDFKPDSEPMKQAKKYRETQCKNDKKQVFEFYEML